MIATKVPIRMRETAATAIAAVLIEEDVDLTVQGNSKYNCELLLLVKSLRK